MEPAQPDHGRTGRTVAIAGGGELLLCHGRRAEVLANVAARTVADAMNALAGVAVSAHPDAWSAAGMAPRNAARRSFDSGGLAASVAATTLFSTETAR